MATLQRIRNRAGLLIAIIIGMAIFAFVIQDFIGSGQPVRGRNQLEMAEIDGRTIQYQEYQQRVDRLADYYRIRMGTSSIDEATMENIREQTWQSIIQEYTTRSQYDELGVAVSTDELMDMVQGRNPHPIISSIFSDPETGILNRSLLVQFIRTMDEDPTGQQKTIWLFLEDEILKDRAFTKYNNLIRKGLYVTSLEAESSLEQTSRRVDFSYIMKSYNSVADSMISYRESYLQSYYREHQNEYLQEASVDLEYIVFEVNPTPGDILKVRNWIYDIADEFRTGEDVTSLVNLESEIPYEGKNYRYGELSDSINDFMFRADAGDVYGPFLEEGSYRLARLVEINYLPDSVRARHILIQASQTRSNSRASELADSLKTAIENGADFAALAVDYSADASSEQGGDLGWFREGTMIKPFNDACFEGEPGEIQLVESRFGFHVVEVLEQGPEVKMVKVAILSRSLEPSSETYSEVYARAVAFAGQNNEYEKFRTAAQETGLAIRYADEVREFQRTITGLESPREMIRWAFEAGKHEVSQVFESGNSYVVAALAEKREEGIAPLSQIRAEVELAVKKEKKADRIVEQFNALMDAEATLESIASGIDLPVLEAAGIIFSSVTVPGAGMEPRLVAVATNLPEQTLSQPVRGNNGVYLVRIDQVSENPSPGNPDATKQRMTMLLQSQATFEAFEALREAANIEDNRAKFF